MTSEFERNTKLVMAVIALIFVVAMAGFITYLTWPFVLIPLALFSILMAFMVVWFIVQWSIETISENWSDRGR